MEVTLPSELEEKLNRLASERGRDRASLVEEAVARLIADDEWYLREVEKGLASADRGEFLTHEEVGRLIERRNSG